VASFFKQWAGANKKRTGRLVQGRTCDEMRVLWAREGRLPRTRHDVALSLLTCLGKRLK